MTGARAHAEALGVAGAPGPSRLTTCVRLAGGVLVDTGAAAHALDLDARSGIRHVLLSHAHLDHTLGLPFLLGDARPEVLGPKPTLDAVREHLLDGQLWPDLRELATWREIAPGDRFRLPPWEIEVGPAEHTVPCVSFLFRAPGYALAIVGDTRFDESVARWVADRAPDACIVEASYPDALAPMARRFGHQTPSDLPRWRDALGGKCDLLVSHAKPSHEEQIRAECVALNDARLRLLIDGDVIHT